AGGVHSQSRTILPPNAPHSGCSEANRAACSTQSSASRQSSSTNATHSPDEFATPQTLAAVRPCLRSVNNRTFAKFLTTWVVSSVLLLLTTKTFHSIDDVTTCFDNASSVRRSNAALL